MAYYKYSEFFEQSNHEAFDEIFRPGAQVANSGIYHCVVCGHEVTCVATRGPLPPQNHHAHKAGEKPILWRLSVSPRNVD